MIIAGKERDDRAGHETNQPRIDETALFADVVARERLPALDPFTHRPYQDTPLKVSSAFIQRLASRRDMRAQAVHVRK